MTRKLPHDAFETYLALGPARSYGAIAEKFGVCKRSVCTRAKKENWQNRVAQQERAAREQAQKKAIESLEEMNDRHLRLVHLIQNRAIEALKNMPLDNATAAAKALAAAVDQERVIRGEPSDRSVLDVATIIKREYETLMLKPGEKDDWSATGS